MAHWAGYGGIVRSFKLSYELGSSLLGWVGGAVGCELDHSALTGHLMRACLQYSELAKAPAATAAAAAAGSAAPRRPAKSSKKVASAAASWVMDEDEEDDAMSGRAALLDGGVDIHGPCVEEISLLQVSGAGVTRILRHQLIIF